MNFFNKVCIVTGGANGIGRCIAESFLARGANVAIIDVDSNSLEQLEQQYGTEKLLVFHGDLTEEAVIKHFVTAVITRFSHIDYLINNACISKKGLQSHCSYEDFNYVLRLGIAAPYYLTSCFCEYFASGASIVNISSTRAYMSQADTESYSAAKGGISALTHALCMSLSGQVRVNSISPGWINTDAYHSDEAADLLQHPSGRIGTPKDIADMVVFLCSEQASFINGEDIRIDGGMTKQMIYHNDCGWNFDA